MTFCRSYFGHFLYINFIYWYDSGKFGKNRLFKKGQNIRFLFFYNLIIAFEFRISSFF